MAELYRVSYKDEAGKLLQERPIAEIAALPSPRFRSIRESITPRRRPHMPGYFWMSRLNTLVPYQSRLELPVLLQLDYNPQLTAVCPQPFAVHLAAGLVHVPRYYVELGQEEALVIDIRTHVKPLSDSLRQAFEAAQQVCKAAGWRYSIQSDPDPVFLTNLQWLSGYRRKPPHFNEFAEQILDLCLPAPQPIGDLIEKTGASYFVRPVLFHLIWLRLLSVDLLKPLSNQTLVDLPKE